MRNYQNYSDTMKAWGRAYENGGAEIAAGAMTMIGGTVTTVVAKYVGKTGSSVRILNMKELFRKCAVFYSAISMENPPEAFDFDSIGNVTPMQIRRDLDPVLRHGESFSLGLVCDEVITFMKDVLDVDEDECLFWKRFSKGMFLPELVFQDEAKNIKDHPMALWKCRNRLK